VGENVDKKKTGGRRHKSTNTFFSKEKRDFGGGLLLHVKKKFRGERNADIYNYLYTSAGASRIYLKIGSRRTSNG